MFSPTPWSVTVLGFWLPVSFGRQPSTLTTAYSLWDSLCLSRYCPHVLFWPPDNVQTLGGRRKGPSENETQE